MNVYILGVLVCLCVCSGGLCCILLQMFSGPSASCQLLRPQKHSHTHTLCLIKRTVPWWATQQGHDGTHIRHSPEVLSTVCISCFFVWVGVCGEMIHWCCPWSPAVVIVVMVVSKHAANQADVSNPHTPPGTTGRDSDTNRLSVCVQQGVRGGGGGRWGSRKTSRSRRRSQDLAEGRGKKF